MKLTQTSYDLETLGRRLAWKDQNTDRHVLYTVAGEAQVSYQYARRVFRGEERSAGLRVERVLHRLGCPGFEFVEEVAA